MQRTTTKKIRNGFDTERHGHGCHQMPPPPSLYLLSKGRPSVVVDRSARLNLGECADSATISCPSKSASALGRASSLCRLFVPPSSRLAYILHSPVLSLSFASIRRRFIPSAYPRSSLNFTHCASHVQFFQPNPVAPRLRSREDSSFPPLICVSRPFNLCLASRLSITIPTLIRSQSEIPLESSP